MIFYRPDGLPFETSLISQPRHCFLITRLGLPVPEDVVKIRKAITRICKKHRYKVIDATAKVTGRDFLLKIWEFIASTPLSVGICHEEFSVETIMNIYYELGAARAMGKESIIVKSKNSKNPSDLVRDEYIEFAENFNSKFSAYLDEVDENAIYYETMANELEKDPLLAIDYLRRAFLITGDERLRKKAKMLLKKDELKNRAKNSVERLALSF